MVSFADFISFYAFYYDYMRMQCEYTKHFESVRRIRNACAHNVCMLASFKSVPGFKSDLETNFELLGGNIGIGNGTISSCMKVPLLNDFAVMLSVYTKLISSPKIKEITLQEIKDFFDGRMVYRKQYFENNSDIKNAYLFARKVLDYWEVILLKLLHIPKTHLLPVIPLLRHLPYNLHQGIVQYLNIVTLVAALLTSIGEYDVSEYL